MDDFPSVQDIRVIVERYNQLIDYLSDKEEDSLACCGGRVTEKDLEEYLSKDKKASKGECDCGVDHKHNYYDCCAACLHGEHPLEGKAGHVKGCKNGIPPQQEKSKVHHSKILPFDVKIPKGATGIKVYGAGEEFLGREDYAPPEIKEESMGEQKEAGECEACNGVGATKAKILSGMNPCHKCEGSGYFIPKPKPQLKEESPKEDECKCVCHTDDFHLPEDCMCNLIKD